jgi:Flp pilus assembly protein TadD
MQVCWRVIRPGVISLFIPAAVRAMDVAMKKIIVALLLSTALSLSACGEMGKQLFDPDTTFAAFEQPKVKGINDTQEEMAKEAAASGDFARAAQFYQQLVATEKGTPEQVLRYKLGWADAVRRDGDSETALRMFEELHAQNPSNVDIAEGRGLSLMANGKITDAGRAFSEVMEKDPKRWRTLNALGILFVTKNMVPEATAYFTEAINQSPDNPAVLNNAGLSYAVDRQFPRAIEALKQAARVSKSPQQRKQIDLNLAMVHGVSGDFEFARDVAANYLEGAALENNMGLYAHLAKDDTLAKSYLNMALSQSPIFYERAWENMNVLTNAGASDSMDAKTKPAPKPAARAKLPKTEALTAPSTKEKPRTGKKAEKNPPKAPAPTLLPEVQADAPAAPAPDKKPDEVKAAEDAPTDKPQAKPEEKPAGLIITPSEGD